MRFQTPLVAARLVRRYKRFLADVVFPDGSEATAHVPNSGAMLGVQEPGSTVWLSPAAPGRKLAWTLHFVETADGWAGVDTSLPNRIAAEAISAGEVAELGGYASLRREVKYAAASRVDLLLEAPDRPPCFVEIKNVHLKRRSGLAEFPDCRAARSARHMGDLAEEVARGARAVVLFVVQREGCDRFSPAADLDPAFAAALQSAVAAGVEALAYDCAMSPEAVSLRRRIDVVDSVGRVR